MPLLPVELLLDIFESATHVPHLFDIAPHPDAPFIPNDDSDGKAIKAFYRSLPTRLALTLVSRRFKELATPLLYACLPLTSTTTPRLYSSLNASNASLVVHVIMDFQLYPTRHLEKELPSVFYRLHNVHILSMRAFGTTVPTEGNVLFKKPAIMEAMVSSLAPTLRKLFLLGNAPALFTRTDVRRFTTSLTHLEALVSSYESITIMYVGFQFFLGIPFPPALPRLVYINIDDSNLALPIGIAPTHVRYPIWKNRLHSSVLTPSLRCLSISMNTDPSFYRVYTSLGTTCPNLAFLTLSGTFSDLTRLLTYHPLPTVSHLSFEGMWPEYPGAMTAQMERARNWFDALEAACAGQPTVHIVSVLDGRSRGLLEDAMSHGMVDAGRLLGSGVVVDDGEGGTLSGVGGAGAGRRRDDVS